MAHNSIVVGGYIWIASATNGEFDVPVGGKVLSADSKTIRILSDDGNEITASPSLFLKKMHNSSIKGVEDMTNLEDLQEYTILKNLHMRYKNGEIYTYTGNLLVAINPYELLPIYTNAIMNKYKDKKFQEVPPHVFAIADNSYSKMRSSKHNQCIVISGESGAGKTENTKLILQYLTQSSGTHSWIEQQILESNPIMEAFGNAKTVRNNNSSRFGKYITINFNKQGVIEFAKIDQYLLEKTRIVSQNDGERNYHIFYSLLAGLTKEEKKKFDLGNADQYAYLIDGKTSTCDGRNEVEEFSEIRNSMKVLNFSDSDINNIFQLLACFLHLGNLKFKPGSASNTESSDVSDMNACDKIAKLLGTTKVDLNNALTKKSILVQGDTVISPISKDQAAEARHAFVKGIYGKLFIYIIDKINEAIFIPTQNNKDSIGVLDIFGFENFNVNSFEQLCINYANENLQQFFVQHIFRLEQEYYTNEGISWKNISFIDNQEVLDMLGMKTMSVLSLIDEESKFPRGTDETMLAKLNTTHSKKRYFLKPKSEVSSIFGIEHYAGVVHYDIPGFLEKNRDTFSHDLQHLVLSSNNDFLRNLYKDVSADSAKRTFTLSHQFKSSLDALMKTLNSCHPFFVRCIKPNETKQAKVFDRTLCCRQLRYSGMMETAKIRQAGYPIRFTFKDFVDRFRYLAAGTPQSSKGNCKDSANKICLSVFVKNEDYQVGHTKVFLKSYDYDFIEVQRNGILTRYILTLQRRIRGWLCRRRFLNLRSAAIVVQKHWRANGQRSRYLIIRNGYQRLQARILTRNLHNDFRNKRKKIIALQAVCKGYVQRRNGQFGQIFAIVKQRKVDEAALKKSGKGNAKQLAEEKMQQKIADLMKQQPKITPHKDNDESSKLIDDVFSYLPISPEDENKEFMKDEDQVPQLDLSAYNFRKFAATYFVSNANHQYTRKAIKESLLELPTPDDVLAAQAIFITILRFMGDLPEPKYENATKRKQGVMSSVTETLSRSFTNRKEYKEILKQEEKMATMSKSERQKFINMTLKRKTQLLDDLRQGLVEDNYASENYNEWLNNRRTSNLEKLHFIVGHGILRPELRDEILCQICKQLTNNPTKASHARGWILMSICVGCFPPTDRYLNYLKAFIRSGPSGYAPYCEKKLDRTFKNGAREQPPSWLELMASRNKDPINVTVTVMDHNEITVEIDSATTSEEICGLINDQLQLKDSFGFSVFIKMYDKVMSLGSDKGHIMDAISQSEQYAKELGKAEKNSEWQLFYRKEMFTPWHNPSDDPVATNLIYHQVISGIKFGEYRCETEGDIATLIATQYYIENKNQMEAKALHTRIGEYMPTYLVKNAGGKSALEKWEKKVMETYMHLSCVKKKAPEIKAKETVVLFSKMSWPILFSKFFEVVQIEGPEITKANLIIAVNWTGVFLIDDEEHILLELTFADILSVRFEPVPRTVRQKFYLNTVTKEEYGFYTLEGETITNLIQELLDGLKKRSTYLVATQDYKHPTNAPTFLSFKKGDLIVLRNGLIGENIMSASWGYGECNGATGDFPTEHIYILPCLTPPLKHIPLAFKRDTGISSNKKSTLSTMNSARRLKVYTLSNYASEHFRQLKKPVVNQVSVVTVVKKNAGDELWKYSNEPLYLPLLQKVLPNEEFSKEACTSFNAILKYMGDLPAPKARYSNEYTDQIFTPAMKNDLLKDELYCQIMKQLTFNRLGASEEKGWELMHLVTGLFVPSQSLLVELNKFLKCRTHPFVESCLQRLQRVLKFGSRKHAPYSVEVEAVQHKSLQIFHKIYFPNDTDEAFEVDSTTKASELCRVIASRIGLSNTDGFSLFLIISDKVFSIPGEDFFYDFLHVIIDWMRKTKPSWNTAAPLQMQYQIFFMKKMWINSTPGKDLVADNVFYYHQELPKYLHGYHKCSKQDAISLAALILRAKLGDDTANAQQLVPQILKELIPRDLSKVASTSEWKKSILAAYTSNKTLSSDDAKQEFLKIVSRWPTFGSTFFEVKQSSHPTYPERIIVAINKVGVNIIHAHTKDILRTLEFSELNNWSSGNNFFQLTTGNIMRSTKILFETSLGYKMDELLTSYIEYIKSSSIKKVNRDFIL